MRSIRFKSTSPRAGSPSGSSFFGVLTMTKDKPSREEMDQLALCLGRVVITCSMLEHGLTMVIAEILSLNEVQERTLVRPTATTVKITLLNRIAKDYLSQDEYKRVTKVTGEIKNAAEKRNDLIHGLYVHASDTKDAAVLSFSGAARIKGNPIKITPRDLELFIVNINWLIGELSSLRPLFPTIEKAPAASHFPPRKSCSKPA